MSESVVYSEVKYKKESNIGLSKAGAQNKGGPSPEDEVVYASVVVQKDDDPSHIAPPKSAPAESPPKGSKGTGRCSVQRLAVAVMLCIVIVGAIIGLGLHWMNNSSNEESSSETQEGNKNTTPKDSTTDVKKHTDSKDSTPERPSECQHGWKQNGSQCYFFSNRNLTWTQSRDACVHKGSHLAIINDEKEQIFLMSTIKSKMREDEDKFWIGLNDREIEGQWRWVDDSSLDENKTFWLNDKEPDDWKGKNNNTYPDGEDCVRMGERNYNGKDAKGWVDTACVREFKFICETNRVPTGQGIS